MAPENTAATARPQQLRRVLGLWVLALYGLGMIVGAGIYVLLGEVASAAGWGAPVAFIVSAVLAALTGCAYAELVGRVPEAAGEVAYVQTAFGGRWLPTLTGLAIAAVVLAAAASIASATAGYVHQVVPSLAALPDWVPGVVLALAFTVVASLGVREAAWVAALLTLVEVGGLVAVIVLGADSLADVGTHADKLLTFHPAGIGGVLAGAYIAFFAYLGFENLANMAEEAERPGRTVALAIILSIGAAALLYSLVALVALTAVGPERLAGSKAPLCLIVERAGIPCGGTFALVALVAISGGVLAEIMLVARLLFGMARRGLLPGWLAVVSARTRAPVRGAVIAGCIIVVLIVGVPFDWLVRATSGVLLAIFAIVNLSLWRIQRRDGPPAPEANVFTVPRVLPPIAAACSLGLLGLAIFSALR